MQSTREQRVGVLGAGIAGITTAWFLSRKGFDVFVVEREPGAAMGASFANGAQISVSNSMPWSNPRAPFKVLAGLSGRGHGLFFAPQLSLEQYLWGCAFLWNCRRAAARRNLKRTVAICARSRELYRALLEQEKIDCDRLDNGILHFYSDRKEYELSKRMQAQWGGCLNPHRREVSVAEILEIEPALERVKDKIVGGFYAPEDFSGDAHKFSVALAGLCAANGVEFHYGTSITALKPAAAKVAVVTAAGELHADHVVCCLGVQSQRLLRPLGINPGIYPVKGYSITIELRDAQSRRGAPAVSLLDDEHKLVASRLGERLRVAGIAEVGGYDTAIDDRRIELLTGWVRSLFPEVGLQEFSQWAGLRPVTASNVPCVGSSGHPRVWLNCGHGTLGWTGAMATAETVACDIIQAV